MAGVQDQKLARPLRHDAATYRRCRRLMGGRELDGRKLDGAKKVKGLGCFESGPESATAASNGGSLIIGDAVNQVDRNGRGLGPPERRIANQS